MMNKTMICIELLRLLDTKEVLNKNELANLLEINPRNIIEYIKTLQDCGYDIESVRGVYGGYRLNKDSVMPTINLTSKEVEALKSSITFLENQADFLDMDTYLKALSKVIASTKADGESNDLTIIDRYPLVMPREQLQARYNLFREAIKSQFKCEINYESGYDHHKTHIIHPYKTFIYQDSWFVLAWNETVNNFGYFRLNRIVNIRVLKDNFIPLRTYNERDFLDEFGMKQNGDYYHIKLELTNLYTVVNERRYGKNQVVRRIDDSKTILECDMQNKNMIKTFVLGFGSKAKVLEPEWLKEDIRKELLAILEN